MSWDETKQNQTLNHILPGGGGGGWCEALILTFENNEVITVEILEFFQILSIKNKKSLETFLTLKNDKWMIKFETKTLFLIKIIVFYRIWVVHNVFCQSKFNVQTSR